MKKKPIKPLIILATLLVLFILSFLLYQWYKKPQNVKSNSTSTKQEILSQAEIGELNLYHSGIYEVVSRDKNNKITAYKVIGIKKPEPLKLELMTDVEKISKGLVPSSKIQVLERDSSGKITAYRLMKNDSDIVKEW